MTLLPPSIPHSVWSTLTGSKVTDLFEVKNEPKNSGSTIDHALSPKIEAQLDTAFKHFEIRSENRY